MSHPIFKKHERLFFQLLVFRRYFETFQPLKKNEKRYLKEFYDHNFYFVEYFYAYLLTHLAFLFDKVSEYSLVNSSFEVEELENKRLSILEDWKRYKDKILEITANAGILKYEDKKVINIAYHNLRRMDDYEGDRILAFMQSVVELHLILEKFSVHETEKELELKNQKRKRRRKADSEGEGEYKK